MTSNGKFLAILKALSINYFAGISPQNAASSGANSGHY